MTKTMTLLKSTDTSAASIGEIRIQTWVFEKGNDIYTLIYNYDTNELTFHSSSPMTHQLKKDMIRKTNRHFNEETKKLNKDVF